MPYYRDFLSRRIKRLPADGFEEAAQGDRKFARRATKGPGNLERLRPPDKDCARQRVRADIGKDAIEIGADCLRIAIVPAATATAATDRR